MPREKPAKPKARVTKQDQRQKSSSRSYLPIMIIVAVVAIAIAVGYLATSQGAGGGQTFQGFQNGFYSAPRVAIYATYDNSTYQINCAIKVIGSITASRAHHRNSSTIDFFVIANSTSCLSQSGPLGSTNNGTKVTQIADCLAVSGHEPSIFINYSATNSTTIRAGNLYTRGDALFLSECGIASELG